MSIPIAEPFVQVEVNEQRLAEIPTQRHRRKIRGMERDEMHARYPSLRTLTEAPGRAVERAWVATFSARPDAMQALLADYIKQMHAKPGRIGQRPMPKEADVDFHALIYGETTDEAMIAVLPKLIKALPVHLRSDRGFCEAIRLSKTQFRRLMSGAYCPDVNEIQQIAKVLGKAPVYFVEYRQAMVVAALINMMQERPGIATALYSQYLEVRMDR